MDILKNPTTAAFIVHENLRAVTLQYDPDDAGVSMGKTFDADIKSGDLVTVTAGTRHGVTIAKVVDVDVDVDPTTTREFRWVGQVIDNDVIADLEETEKNMLDAIKASARKKQQRELRASFLADADDDVLSVINAAPVNVLDSPS